MTKPKNYYLQPSIKRQLCIDVAWFLSHHGLVPMLVMIDTVEEYASICELPSQYTGEDVLRCVIARLRLDRAKKVEVEGIVSDPESTIGKAFELLKSHKSFSHVVALEVPTKSHVALAESFINKLRIRLRAVCAKFQIQYGVRMPLQFISKMLPNIVEKLNYISNMGSLLMVSPAIQRGEEPLDFNALTALSIGDIVLAYHVGDETRTKAVFTIVLDHSFAGTIPSINSGFNLETPKNTSAGNSSISKYKRIPAESVPPFIIQSLKELEKKGQSEAAATLKKARKRKDKLARLISKCDDNIKRMELELKLKESPPELEEVLATIKESEPVELPLTQGGEVQGGESVNLKSTDTDGSDKDSHAADNKVAEDNDSNQDSKSHHADVVIKTTDDKEIIEPVHVPIEPVAIEPIVPIQSVATHR